MMFRKLSILFLLLSSFIVEAQIPLFKWVQQISGDQGLSITEDTSGNIYLAGVFSGTVDLDPGPGTSALSSNGSGDVFVSKFDKFGVFKWAKSFGGSHLDEAYSIKSDAAGNVVLTGQF